MYLNNYYCALPHQRKFDLKQKNIYNKNAQCLFRGLDIKNMYSKQETEEILKVLNNKYKNLGLSPFAETKTLIEQFIKNEIEQGFFAKNYNNLYNSSAYFLSKLSKEDLAENINLFEKEFELSRNIIALIRRFEHHKDTFKDSFKNCIIE